MRGPQPEAEVSSRWGPGRAEPLHVPYGMRNSLVLSMGDPNPSSLDLRLHMHTVVMTLHLSGH